MRVENYHCKKCNHSWVAPDRREEAWWRNLASKRSGLVPQGGVMDWMRHNTSFNEVSIKIIVIHQSWEVGLCCHCNRALDGHGVVECGHCNGLNYNFS